MTNPQQPASPAAWHPALGGGQNYWDGTAWTHHADWNGTAWALQAMAASPAVKNPNHGNLVSGGYIFAVLMPLIGFVLGLVAVTRDEPATSKHGMKIIGLSIVAFLIYLKLGL
jgi:hypothetical protein